MGVDARIILKIKGKKPSEYMLKEWSWQLCRSIGARHFFINDGLPPAEYKLKNEAWHAAFDAHPEYPAFMAAQKASRHEDKRPIHERILADIGDPPKERRMAIDLTPDYEEQGRDGKVYEQDGDDVLAANDEWMLSVSVWTRYYGIGYERGDLLTICAIAEWCEANIPDCTVFYGGDSSGVCAEPFDESERLKLRKHLYSQKGRDYFNYGIESNVQKMPPACSLCPDAKPRFNQHGFGGNYAAISCAGCGASFETRDNCKTWTKKDKNDD